MKNEKLKAHHHHHHHHHHHLKGLNHHFPPSPKNLASNLGAITPR